MISQRLTPTAVTAIIILPCLAVLQQGITPNVTFSGARPDIVMLAVLNWSLIRGTEEGMLWGVIGGVVVDLFSGLPFGTSSLAYCTIAGLVTLGQRFLRRAHILLPMIAGCLATLVYYFVSIILTASFQHILYLNGTMLRTVIAVAIFNAVVNPLIYIAAQALDRRLDPAPRTNW